MRSILALLVFTFVSPLLLAQEGDVRAEVNAIARWQQDEIQRRTGGSVEIDALSGRSPVLDAITAEARQKLEKLIRKHGPGGHGVRKDVTAAWRALANLQEYGDHARTRRLAERIVLEDPESDAAWHALEKIYSAFPPVTFHPDGRREEAPVPEPEASLLRWALRLRIDRDGDGAGARAADLLIASLALGRGQRDAAKSAFEHAAASKTRALRDGARRLLGLVDKKTVASPRPMPWRDVASLVTRARERDAADRLLAAGSTLGKDVASQLALLGVGAAADALPEPTADLHGAVAWAHARVESEAGAAAWKRILRRLREREPARRLAVVDAIYDLGIAGEHVRKALESAVRGTRDWRTVSMALRALAHQDATTTPRPLLGKRKDKRWQVRLSLAEALGGYRHKDAVDGLIELLGDERLRVRIGAAETLARLTGFELGTSRKAWVAWRRERGATWAVPSREEAALRRGKQARPDGYERRPRWYGLDIPSDHVTFVLDKSGSMWGGLWTGAVREVATWLSARGKRTRYSVIEFADGPRVWSPRVMPADEKTVKKTIGFLNATHPDGRTNIIDALRKGRAIKGADTEVLLSDGLPNRGDPSDPAGIIEATVEENRYLRLQIHTVQLLVFRYVQHDAPKGAEDAPPTEEEKRKQDQLRRLARTSELGRFLRELAARNDGTYHVAFGAQRLPPPGTPPGPGVDW